MSISPNVWYIWKSERLSIPNKLLFPIIENPLMSKGLGPKTDPGISYQSSWHIFSLKYCLSEQPNRHCSNLCMPSSPLLMYTCIYSLRWSKMFMYGHGANLYCLYYLIYYIWSNYITQYNAIFYCMSKFFESFVKYQVSLDLPIPKR